MAEKLLRRKQIKLITSMQSVSDEEMKMYTLIEKNTSFNIRHWKFMNIGNLTKEQYQSHKKGKILKTLINLPD